MNKDRVKGKLKEIKGTVKAKVGEHRNDPVQVNEGQTEKLIGKIQKGFGKLKDKLK